MKLTQNEARHLVNIIMDYMDRSDYLEETWFPTSNNEVVTTQDMLDKLVNLAEGNDTEKPFPEYPTQEIPQPEALLLVVSQMRENATKIQAYDWSDALAQIQKLLLWVGEVKLYLLSEAPNDIRNHAKDGRSN